MPTFKDAFQALRDVQASKSPNTIAQCNSILKHLETWFTEHANDLSQFEAEFEQVWSRYKADQAKVSTRKLSHDRRYLVQALKRAERRQWIRKTFKKSDFDLFEASTPVGKHVDDDGVKKLLGAIKNNPKALLQVLMAVTMGMRKSEILKLSKPEIDFDKRVIRLNPNRLKTRQARKVDIPITDEVFPLLKHFYDEAQGLYIFPKIDTRTNGPKHPVVMWDEPQTSNTHVWTLARKLAGVNCRFHDLRHTCASNLVSSGYPTLYITQLLGMSEAMLKNIYAHLQEDDAEKFRKASSGRFGIQPDTLFTRAKKALRLK